MRRRADWGYTATELMNKITPADISDPQEVITRRKALSAELETTARMALRLVFKASRGIEDIYELTYIRRTGSAFRPSCRHGAARLQKRGSIGYLFDRHDNTRASRWKPSECFRSGVRDQQSYTRSLIESTSMRDYHRSARHHTDVKKQNGGAHRECTHATS